MDSQSPNLFGIPIAIELLNPCSVVLTALVFGLPWKIGLRHWKWFKSEFNQNKYVFWLHGVVSFGLMWCSQPQNLEMLFGGSNREFLSIVQFGLVSLLAIILWDFGFVNETFTQEWSTWFLLNCHHAGLFLAIIFGPGWNIDSLVDNEDDEGSKSNLEQQVRLDTFLFAWLWMSHSFGFFIEIILPHVFRVHLEEGSRSGGISILQHAYALRSVYLFHQCVNFNLNKLLTYQTTALFVTVFSRFLVLDNWRRIDWIRRIEAPGFVVVVVDRMLGFHDTFCQRTLAILVGSVGIYLLHSVFLADRTPWPQEYFGPENHPELKNFLAEEADKVRGVSLTEDEFEAAKKKWEGMQSWMNAFISKKKTKEGTLWTQQYPVHSALVAFEPRNLSQTENFVNLLDKIGKKSLDQPLKEWFNSTPLEWSVTLQYSYECTLILLQRGAVPYGDRNNNAVAGGMKDSFNQSATGKKGALGFSDGFWERFNELCLQKSPPKVLTNKERLFEVLKSF